MSLRKLSITFLLFGLVFVFALSSQDAMAQSTDEPKQTEKRIEEVNLDTQLYLLIGTNQEVGNEKLPAVLDPVLKQLRASLPFKNYKLTATLINRVRNEGRLNLKWVGGPVLASAQDSASTPSFNDFKISLVRLIRDADGQQLVRMEGFGFGARIPVQTVVAVASNSPSASVVNYENTGLNTDFSLREGHPVVVGTLNLGSSGDAIILVMSAKRSIQ